MPDSGAVQGARARRVAHRAWPRTSVWYLLAPHSPHTRPHRLPPPSGRSPSGCSGPPQRSEARRARGGARGPRAREKRATEGPGWSGQGLSRRARPPARPNAPQPPLWAPTSAVDCSWILKKSQERALHSDFSTAQWLTNSGLGKWKSDSDSGFRKVMSAETRCTAVRTPFAPKVFRILPRGKTIYRVCLLL